MHSYTPPLKDILFALNEVLNAPASLAALPAFAEVDSALMLQVIEEAGRFASDILSPLNAPGDRHGCRFDNGAAHTPPGFADAYRQFCATGWAAMTCAPEDGGQGLPHVLNCVLYEMLSAANHGWTMYPGSCSELSMPACATARKSCSTTVPLSLRDSPWLPDIQHPRAGPEHSNFRQRRTRTGDNLTRTIRAFKNPIGRTIQ